MATKNRIINVHEAKTHLSRLLEEVLNGAEIILGKSGKPIARLVPYQEERPSRVPGMMKGAIRLAPDFDALPEDILSAFEGRRP